MRKPGLLRGAMLAPMVVVFATAWAGGQMQHMQWTRSASEWGMWVRGCHAMAYDAARKRVVLFGGSTRQGYLNDAREWDGAAWTQRTSATSPGLRDPAAEHRTPAER